MSGKIKIEEIKLALKKIDNELCVIVGESAKSGKENIIIADPNWHFMVSGDKFNVHLEGGPSRFALHYEVSPYEPHSNLTGNLLNKNDKERDELRKIFSNKIKINNVIEDKARGNAVLTILNYRIEEEYNINKFCKIIIELIKEITSVLESEGYELITGIITK